MSRLYPKVLPDNLTCAVCNISFERSKAFRMFNVTCCSNTCIEVIRKERQPKEETNKPSQGAFGVGGPGAYAF